MKDIEILTELPIVFTKDRKFAGQFKDKKSRKGDIITLPEDAILVVPPVNVEVVSAPREVKLDKDCSFCGKNPCTSQFLGCGETQAVYKEQTRIVEMVKTLMEEYKTANNGREPYDLHGYRHACKDIIRGINGTEV